MRPWRHTGPPLLQDITQKYHNIIDDYSQALTSLRQRGKEDSRKKSIHLRKMCIKEPREENVPFSSEYLRKLNILQQLLLPFTFEGMTGSKRKMDL